jgi:hypothetical protein
MFLVVPTGCALLETRLTAAVRAVAARNVLMNLLMSEVLSGV